MTKNDIISILKETAAKHGFTAEESSWYRWPNITEQGTHYLNYPDEIVIPSFPLKSANIGIYKENLGITQC